MSGRTAGRPLIPAAAAALALGWLSTLPAANWAAVAAKLTALPWDGPLWWLLRTALILARGIF